MPTGSISTWGRCVPSSGTGNSSGSKYVQLVPLSSMFAPHPPQRNLTGAVSLITITISQQEQYPVHRRAQSDLAAEAPETVDG